MNYYLKNISLYQFKNYAIQQLSLNARFNAFVGLNGVGKTNMLDAIHVLLVGKSFFSTLDKEIIKFYETETSIRGNVSKDGIISTIEFKMWAASKKELFIDKKRLLKASDYFGKFPVVVITPNDVHNLLLSSANRRSFFDKIICQVDKNYLVCLQSYHRLLKQRNALLFKFNQDRSWNESLMSILESQIFPLAELIHSRRKLFLEKFRVFFVNTYKHIKANFEEPNIEYSSTLEQETLEEQFLKNREKDKILKRTSAGVHKDDYKFFINNNLIKSFASQGQLKSFIIALKLSKFEFLTEEMKTTPTILLDDVFDKLDYNRIKALLNLLIENKNVQIFLTDTNKERVSKLLKELKQSYSLFEVEQGKIKEN